MNLDTLTSGILLEAVQPVSLQMFGGEAVNVARCCLKECGLGCAYDLIFFLCVSLQAEYRHLFFLYTVCIKTDGILCDQ